MRFLCDKDEEDDDDDTGIKDDTDIEDTSIDNWTSMFYLVKR